MTAYDPDNIFAKILRGEIPAYKVYEDDDALAFMDVMPQSDGHTLILPKVPSRNLLDADPDVAARAGFPRPILHGLCTYGIAARLLITRLLGHDPDRLLSLDVRFSSAVYPGETLSLECWRAGDVLSFQALVRERGKKVLDNGHARIRL